MAQSNRLTGRTRSVPPGELLAELEARAGSLTRPARARRAIKRRSRTIAAVIGGALLMVALVLPTLAVHDEGFQLEGNATAGDLSYTDIDKVGNTTTKTDGTLVAPFDGPYDWDSLFDISGTPAAGNAQGEVTGVTSPLPGDFTAASFQKDFRNTGTTFVTSDPTTFATGSKDTLPISGWQCNQDNNVNSKTDIINGFAALAENSSKILYFGLEKDVDNGDNNVGFWLLQDGNVDCSSSGGAVDFTGEHQEGDLFVVSAFTNGGGVSSVTAYRWVNDADSNKPGDQPGIDPTPVAQGADCLDSNAGDTVCATVNGRTIRMPWLSADGGDVNSDKLSPNFFEGAINLDAFPEFADKCYGDFILNTRSSQSLGANLFDYVRGSLNTCHPELSLEKTPDSGTYFVGDSFDWTIQVSNTGNGDATGAVVADTIPTGLTINSATTPAGSCSVNGQDVSCTIDVAVGATATITVNVTATSSVLGTPTACQTVNNSASVSVGGERDTSDNSDSGSVDVCPIVVTKDANTSYTRTWNWSIDKSVDPAVWNLFTGESGTSDYTVDVTKTGHTDSAFHASGNITVHNPAPIAATINSVSDVLATDGGATVSCGVSFPYSLAAGGDLNCTWSKDTAAATNQLNTATATLQNSPSGTTDWNGTASVDFGSATITDVNATVDVTDTNGASWQFGGSGSVSYSRTFSCNGDQGTHNNTATITQTGQSDSASVTVNCYEIAVSKDASTTYQRKFFWTIDKFSTDPNGGALTLNPGETYVDYPYSIKVDVDHYTDSDWAVSGNIHVSNAGNPIPATINSVSDVISGPIAATVDCGVSFPYTLAAGATLNCTYSAALPNANSRTNTATATRQNHNYDSDLNPTNGTTVDKTGTASVTFGAPTTLIDESVTIVDDYGTPGDTSDDLTFGPLSYSSAPHTYTYTRTFGPFGTDACGQVTIDNTVTFTTNDTSTTGTDHWPLVITIPCPTGCTLTQGYWKTHSEFGPAPEDLNWYNLPGGLGPNTVFFLSGQTWYEVFWTTPKGGNAYYILAHQYEAAVLNILSPTAAPQSVLDAITWSESFFSTYTPSQNLSKTVRQQAIYYAGILGSYNTGAIGPGHCSEDSVSAAAPS